jgi:hypothetical protein
MAIGRVSARLRTTCLWTCESEGTSMTTSPSMSVWHDNRRPGFSARFSA